MDRRKKRTSTNQYMLYIDLMESDSIFATGRVPRDFDVNYLQNKWKELSSKLNTCSSGPKLTAEEWRKRLNDWKNTTRCKYRRSQTGEKDISLTSLELKALELFGKQPNVSTLSEKYSIQLKSEKEDPDGDGDGDEELEQRTSESLQKELQAAVEEAIMGDDEDEEEDHEDHEEILSDPIHPPAQPVVVTSGGTGGTTTTTYRTIVVENTQYTDDDNDNDEQLEFITQRRVPLVHSTPASTNTVSTVTTGVQTIGTSGTTVTKLINGDIPLKRLRTQAPNQIIYEVKNAPQSKRSITIHNSGAPITTINHHQQQTQHPEYTNAASSLMHDGIASALGAQDAREIGRQLKRMADIKAEQLKFEIARFKFNNPGFHYNCPML